MVLVVNPFNFAQQSVKSEADAPFSIPSKRSSDAAAPMAYKHRVLSRSPPAVGSKRSDKIDDEYDSDDGHDPLLAEAAVQEIEQREKWRTKSGTIENVSHADSTYGKLNASNFLAHPLQSTTTQGIDKNVGNPPSPPSTSENCYGTNPWDGKSVDEWLQGGSDISDRFNDLVRRLTIIMKRKVDRVNTCRSILDEHESLLNNESSRIDRARIDINKWAEVMSKDAE